MRSHYQREELIWGSSLDSSERLLLLCLNSFVDGDGECWPGLDRISEMTGLSDRTITRITNRLTEIGVLEKWRRRSKNLALSNKYRINFDAIPQRPEKEAKKTLVNSKKCQIEPDKMSGSTRQNVRFYPTKCQVLPDKMSDDLSNRSIQIDLSSRSIHSIANEKNANSEKNEAEKAKTEKAKSLTARTVKEKEGSVRPINAREDQNSAGNFFEKFAIDAPYWLCHAAPWHLNAREFDPDMLESVFLVNHSGEYYRLPGGGRNDYAIAAQLRKLEARSQEKGLSSDWELARNKLLDYWEFAQKLKQRRSELAIARGTESPFAANAEPKIADPTVENPEFRKAKIQEIRNLVHRGSKSL